MAETEETQHPQVEALKASIAEREKRVLGPHDDKDGLARVLAFEKQSLKDLQASLKPATKK